MLLPFDIIQTLAKHYNFNGFFNTYSYWNYVKLVTLYFLLLNY